MVLQPLLPLLPLVARAMTLASGAGAAAAPGPAAGAPAAAGAAPVVQAATQAAAQSGLAGSLSSYLAVAGVLFLLGVMAILTRRNALYVLMGVELILNAANLNFVAFARFGGYGLDGQMFAVFVVILAAAEAAIALAIVLRIFHDFGSIDITRTDSLRD